MARINEYRVYEVAVNEQSPELLPTHNHDREGGKKRMQNFLKSLSRHIFSGIAWHG